MKRALLLLLFAIGSIILGGYAALKFFMACMAASALVGVPSRLVSQHHYAVFSWLWLAIAFAAALGFIASVFGLVRHYSRLRRHD